MTRTETAALKPGDKVEKFGGRYGGPGRIVGVTYDLGDGYKLYSVAMKVDGGYGEFVHVFPATVLRAALSPEPAQDVTPVAFMASDNMRAITQCELDTIPNDKDRRDRCANMYPTRLYDQATVAKLKAERDEWRLRAHKRDAVITTFLHRAEKAEASLAEMQRELERLRKFEATALVSLTELDQALGKQNLALTACQKREAGLRENVIALIRDYGEDSLPDSEYRVACNDLIEAFESGMADRITYDEAGHLQYATLNSEGA